MVEHALRREIAPQENLAPDSPYEMGPDDLSLADTHAFPNLPASPHLTALYLLALAVKHGGRFATLDANINAAQNVSIRNSRIWFAAPVFSSGPSLFENGNKGIAFVINEQNIHILEAYLRGEDDDRC